MKITRYMLGRKVKESKNNIGYNSQCMYVKYDAKDKVIRTSNIRSTRYKKFVVEIMKANLKDNNLEYNENQLELIVIDDTCKYYEYHLKPKSKAPEAMEEVQDWELEEAIAEAEAEAELDEEVAAYEAKVEAEEDERGLKEKKRKDKETERKRLNTVYRKRKDEAFYDEWSEKLTALKNLIPTTENNFKGKGKDKKFRAEYRRKGKLLFHIIKNLNLEGY